MHQSSFQSEYKQVEKSFQETDKNSILSIDDERLINNIDATFDDSKEFEKSFHTGIWVSLMRMDKYYDLKY